MSKFGTQSWCLTCYFLLGLWELRWEIKLLTCYNKLVCGIKLRWSFQILNRSFKLSVCYWECSNIMNDGCLCLASFRLLSVSVCLFFPSSVTYVPVFLWTPDNTGYFLVRMHTETYKSRGDHMTCYLIEIPLSSGHHSLKPSRWGKPNSYLVFRGQLHTELVFCFSPPDHQSGWESTE